MIPALAAGCVTPLYVKLEETVLVAIELQAEPALVLCRTTPTPATRIVFVSKAAMEVRFAEVPEVSVLQVEPPLVVFKMVPELPTT